MLRNRLIGTVGGAAFLASSLLFAQEHNYIPDKGYVPDAKTAVSIARAVLIPVYGQKVIAKEEPFHARLLKGVWIVEGSEPPMKPGYYYLGGLAEVRISKKTGAIVRMTHGK